MIETKRENRQLKNKKVKAIVLLGVTASGKTNMAVSLAKQIDGEIISVDSRQVFQGMDIGTGKDLLSYGPVPFHLINILQPGERFSVADFQEKTTCLIGSLQARNKIPILCGGSAYYVKALLQKYIFLSKTNETKLMQSLSYLSIPELLKQAELLGMQKEDIGKSDTQRRLLQSIGHFLLKQQGVKPKNSQADFEINAQVFYVTLSREEQRENILQRLDTRIKEGLIEEVQNLLEKFSFQEIEAYGLEYKWVSLYLRDEITKEYMISKLGIEICRFAKRQSTFLRYMEKEGIKLYPISNEKEFIQGAKLFLQNKD